MSSLGALLLFACIGAGTFAMRFSFVALMSRLKLPAWSAEVLSFVPTAVLSALILPQLVLAPDGSFLSAQTHPTALAGIAAIVAALLSRNVLVTIVIGIATLWVSQAVLA